MFPSSKTLNAVCKDATQRFGQTQAQSAWVECCEPAPRVENLGPVLQMGRVFTEYMPVATTAHMPLRPQLTSRVEFHWKQAADFEINKELVHETRMLGRSGTSKLPDVLPRQRSRYAEVFKELTPQQTWTAQRETYKPKLETIRTIVCPGESSTRLSAAHRNSMASQAAFRKGATYHGEMWRPPTNTGRPMSYAPGAFKSSHKADFGAPFGKAESRARERQALRKTASAPSGLFQDQEDADPARTM